KRPARSLALQSATELLFGRHGVKAWTGQGHQMGPQVKTRKEDADGYRWPCRVSGNYVSFRGISLWVYSTNRGASLRHPSLRTCIPPALSILTFRAPHEKPLIFQRFRLAGFGAT